MQEIFSPNSIAVIKSGMKKCNMCGKEFFKPPHCGNQRWDDRKYCSLKCYYQLSKNKPEDVWKQINRKSEDECWEWIGKSLSKGYGHLRINNKDCYSHRMVYIETYGSIPEGLCILHTCNNPKCCNPKHLYVGTHADNMEQMSKDGRSNMGEKHPNSRLSNQIIIKIRFLYSTGKYSQKCLGKMVGVSQGQISRIIKKDGWKHI